MSIVLDAMGGDFAPQATIDGAIKAAELGINIHLVGPEERLSPLCRKHAHINIVHATDVVGMSDSPSGVIRRRKDSSIVVGVKLAKELGIPFVSAGNTGACMAAALFTFGRLPGIKRPPIASLFPQISGGECVILDVGANVDCSAENLLNFAVMGSAYCQSVLGVAEPRVGLMSNGEEPGKGNSLTLEAYDALKESVPHFVGNVEGFDVLSGKCDVIVCDGFVGNILLKTTEGIVKSFQSVIRGSIADLSSISSDLQNVLAKLAKFNPDNREHSGAPLLGIDGTCFIVHGSASSKTITGAIQAAHKLGESGLVSKIRNAIEA